MGRLSHIGGAGEEGLGKEWEVLWVVVAAMEVVLATTSNSRRLRGLQIHNKEDDSACIRD